METITKQVSFRAIEIGTEFEFVIIGLDGITPHNRTQAFKKISARKAVNSEGTEMVFQPTAQVIIEDRYEMTRRAEFLAKPLFDGTEASCKSRKDFFTLSHAMRNVTDAMAKLDEMADYMTDKMASIKRDLRRDGVKDTATPSRYDRFDVPVASIVTYTRLNSCGEIQGNGNIGALIMTLIAKRETFAMLVTALGYRVNDEL